MKKNLMNFLFVFMVLLISIYILFSSKDITQLKDILDKSNKVYILLSLLSMIIFWILDGQILFNVIKMMGIEFRYIYAIKTIFVGQYFMSITPFSSGGPPALIYSLKKHGVKVWDGSIIILVKYIINEIALGIFIVIGYMYNKNILDSELKYIKPFILFGIVVSIIIGFFILINFLNTEFTERLIKYLLSFMKKIGLSKKKKMISKIEHTVEEYKISVEKIKNTRKIVIKIVILNILKLLIYYNITYLVFRTFGDFDIKVKNIITLQPLLEIAIAYIPIPGKSGAAEAGFYLMFQGIFSSEKLIYGVILWRVVTYYSRIIVGGLITLIDKIYIKEQKRI
ncbi:lysylphosphatidylglycerol synthase transmembrane domain-containing protein [Clostridiisalibacter paucivorans]|uniref:lysylphosphatidylglycerol synthase transmembrane domain-containing protein n=1 Tax=Clostridiisalibacter paucivorans TaxID=408753 RepID=UPI00047CCA68|nr:lysylphosphatidylglycerol synthase transmembrane domain-containing protein [Clostridiisalibacter paucivorans]